LLSATIRLATTIADDITIAIANFWQMFHLQQHTQRGLDRNDGPKLAPHLLQSGPQFTAGISRPPHTSLERHEVRAQPKPLCETHEAPYSLCSVCWGFAVATVAAVAVTTTTQLVVVVVGAATAATAAITRTE
jgi:hypothetical protein